MSRRILPALLCLGLGLVMVLSAAAADEVKYDLRNTTWGMTIEEVKAAETAQLVKEKPAQLQYKLKLEGHKTQLYYYFKDGRLYKGMYEIETRDFEADLALFINALNEKYGKAQKGGGGFLSNLLHARYWETETTGITLDIKRQSRTEAQILIIYQARKPQPRDTDSGEDLAGSI